MKEAYFSKQERVRYVLAHEITLPYIREKVLKNPQIKKVYRTLFARYMEIDVEIRRKERL